MADSTTHYGLVTDVVTDDVIEPDHHNSLADTLDRILGNFLQKVMVNGAYSGWELTAEGTVAAGEGLVGGCWCTTETEQQIADLVFGTVNYVYGKATATSGRTGEIAFCASSSAGMLQGAVFLGYIELDTTGEVVAVHMSPVNTDRHCRRLAICPVEGEATALEVAAGTSFKVPVFHDAFFVVPGCIELLDTTAGFDVQVMDTADGFGFVIAGENTGTETADFHCTWRRWGFVGETVHGSSQGA